MVGVYDQSLKELKGDPRSRYHGMIMSTARRFKLVWAQGGHARVSRRIKWSLTNTLLNPCRTPRAVVNWASLFLP